MRRRNKKNNCVKTGTKGGLIIEEGITFWPTPADGMGGRDGRGSQSFFFTCIDWFKIIA